MNVIATRINTNMATQPVSITTRAAVIALALATLAMIGCATDHAGEIWLIDTAEQWQQAHQSSEHLNFDNGMATPTAEASTFRSVMHRFDSVQQPQSIVFRQSPTWLNWQPIGNLGPTNLGDAPVLLAKGPDDYWAFGQYNARAWNIAQFTAEPAELEGFDIPLMTTPWPNQYDAPGGLQPRLGGYHAWQSRDMVNWVHHGPVTERFSKWVTTAEYAHGKTYIYYDYPNDQDPHVYVDDDLADGKPGKNIGMAFGDPSDGSDCAMIRDLQGNFHVIYEDWTPINARKHSWDSPLAGHAVIPNGVGNFEIMPPAVDHRTEPTGETATYEHPHWKQHPDWDSNTATYQVHKPEQNAFGDWAAISVGGQYYLFSDFHPVNDKIRLAWFTSDSIDKPFLFCGELGLGHPDPDIIFANGQFYLFTQMKTDYVSSGPWVESVEVRVGVDTTNDGKADTWTDWQTVREHYNHIAGFAKQISRTPAAIDLTDLPASFGVCFEFRTTDPTDNHAMPIIDSVQVIMAKTFGTLGVQATQKSTAKGKPPSKTGSMTKAYDHYSSGQ